MGRRVIEEESDEESVFSAEESEDEERPSPRRSASRSGGADGGALRPIASHTPMEILAGGIAGASVGTSVAAMIIQPVNIVFAAGALSR